MLIRGVCTSGKFDWICGMVLVGSDHMVCVCDVQDELQSMQARAQYAESRAAVAEAELQSLRKVRLLCKLHYCRPTQYNICLAAVT